MPLIQLMRRYHPVVVVPSDILKLVLLTTAAALDTIRGRKKSKRR